MKNRKELREEIIKIKGNKANVIDRSSILKFLKIYLLEFHISIDG